MDWSDDPSETIDQLMEEYRQLNDQQLLNSISNLAPLKNEDDPLWDDLSYWHSHTYPFEALSRVTSQRKLEDAIPLILDRMCFGDPGEIMRGICHGFEYIVEPDYAKLEPHYRHAAASARSGTRLWALTFLARLRDPKTRGIFEGALGDSEAQVRSMASRGIRLIDSSES